MTDHDETIRNLLREEAADPGADADSIPSLILDGFRGRSRATALFAWMKMTGTLAICLGTAIGFFTAESVRAQIAWATGFTAGFVGFAMWWIWYWMFLNRNAALREIKRLELQIAALREGAAR